MPSVASGKVVFLAGQTALDGEGRIVGDTVVEQFEQSAEQPARRARRGRRLARTLASLTIYIVDVDDYRANSRAIGGVWRRLVGDTYPAMAAVGVARLWDAEALVELQGYAVLPD